MQDERALHDEYEPVPQPALAPPPPPHGGAVALDMADDFGDLVEALEKLKTPQLRDLARRYEHD